MRAFVVFVQHSVMAPDLENCHAPYTLFLLMAVLGLSTP